MVQFDVKTVQRGAGSFMVSFDFVKTPITKIVDYIIIEAAKHKSSDIHFDPRENGLVVRFRIDGDCQDYAFVPSIYEKNLTTRLKILAGMNITESRLPQDGAIKGLFGGQYLDMRVSSLPLNEGEKLVVRILDYSRSLQGIDKLGFHPKNLEKIKRMLGIPNGIILATGATGSGKSTTTYTMLEELNKPETNIITVEDPIEMNIEGVNQVQVNSEIGMTFATALRSILRQDPNVILIGEIRDSETAQIAVRASITGHLVLSTIHTNNALSTVERLLDMDVERYLLSSALTGIISQRLTKMLCPHCRYQRETTDYEKMVFKKYMNMDIAHVWDANPKGCQYCRNGYHGRIAIHEVLEINDDIRMAISDELMEKPELARLVYDGNTITMLQDALIKCLEGITSFEEVYRTIEIENEEDEAYESKIADDFCEFIPKETLNTEDTVEVDAPEALGIEEEEEDIEAHGEEPLPQEEMQAPPPVAPQQTLNPLPVSETQQVVIPQQVQAVSQQIAVPQQVAVPQQTVIPQQIQAVPQQMVMPQQVVVPQQMTVPQQVAIPQQMTMPQQVTIPQQQVSMPQQTVASPQQVVAPVQQVVPQQTYPVANQQTFSRLD